MPSANDSSFLSSSLRTYEGPRTKRLRKSNQQQTLPTRRADEADVLPTRIGEDVLAAWKLKAVLCKTSACEVVVVEHAQEGLRVVKRISKCGWLGGLRRPRQGSRGAGAAPSGGGGGGGGGAGELEVKILANLQHEGIVRMHCAFETEEYIKIMMEYCPGGNLLEHIQRARHFPEPRGRLLFQRLCMAVHYLHNQGVVHRDLKPENVLLTSRDRGSMRPKLADFGLSRFCATAVDCRTYCGTRSYTAPEVIKQKEGRRRSAGYGKPADVWGLGVILYMVLSGGVPPFDPDQAPDRLHDDILKGSFGFDVDEWASVSGAAKSLVRRLMATSPTERPDLGQILRDPWFSS